MEENNLKRYTILLLTLLFLYKVLSCSIVPETEKAQLPRCPEISEATELSSAEIDNFLTLWKEYVKEGYDKKVSNKISLMDGNLEDNLPLSLKLWFNNNCITAKRFYYIEERLRASLQTIYLKRHSSSIIAVLNEKMKDAEDGAKEAYVQMIEEQNKIANIENISDNEIKIVEMLEAEIVKVLGAK